MRPLFLFRRMGKTRNCICDDANFDRLVIRLKMKMFSHFQERAKRGKMAAAFEARKKLPAERTLSSRVES